MLAMVLPAAVVDSASVVPLAPVAAAVAVVMAIAAGGTPQSIDVTPFTSMQTTVVSYQRERERERDEREKERSYMFGP